MEDQMTKSKLLETLRSKRAEGDALLAQVPLDRMTEPGVAGEWSVKDIIVHLTYHERWIADRLHEGLRGESYVPNEIDALPFDERNDVVFQRNRNRPLSDVLEESRRGVPATPGRGGSTLRGVLDRATAIRGSAGANHDLEIPS